MRIDDWLAPIRIPPSSALHSAAASAPGWGPELARWLELERAQMKDTTWAKWSAPPSAQPWAWLWESASAMLLAATSAANLALGMARLSVQASAHQ